MLIYFYAYVYIYVFIYLYIIVSFASFIRLYSDHSDKPQLPVRVEVLLCKY